MIILTKATSGARPRVHPEAIIPVISAHVLHRNQRDSPYRGIYVITWSTIIQTIYLSLFLPVSRLSCCYHCNSCTTTTNNNNAHSAVSKPSTVQHTDILIRFGTRWQTTWRRSSHSKQHTTCTYSKSMDLNWVRLSVLHVVSWTGKMNIFLSAFAPENLVSRNGFGSPVPRQPAHLDTQAESGAYLRDSSRVLLRRPFSFLQPPYAIGLVPSLSGHAIVYRWRLM